MGDTMIGVLAVGGLLVLVLLGVPIGFSLILISILGMLALTQSLDLAALLVADSALGGVRRYVFAVIPLFILMGAFMSNSTAARDLYNVAHIVTRRLIGGLASATVLANAVFSAVTGVSVASAAIFSRIAVPQMMRHGYGVRLAVGSVAGSAILGMLIPPSVLMILYGVLAQVSIGGLFIAGVVPGLLLALLYMVTITLIGLWRPEVVGRAARKGGDTTEPDDVAPQRSGTRQLVAGATTHSGRRVGYTEAPPEDLVLQEAVLPESERHGWRASVAVAPIGILIAVVIGGIWIGWFTPTEASAVGALGALTIAIASGMRRRGLINSFKETAVSTGGIMLLLIAAQMYSRMLARSGIIVELNRWLTQTDLRPYTLVLAFVVVLILLGAILDSASIVLIMVPLMSPTVQVLGLDPLWFGIVMIVAIEVGMLTPPFGMVAFSMSAVLGKRASVEDIFVGAVPFIVAMLVLVGMLMVFPGLATWLPGRL